ncbi:MAG: hypothetical protein WC795_01510 [Candidatus Paceibacterota bacterium]|jgi:hypothetical protein
MKKNILTSSIIIVTGFIVSIGVSYAAGAWSNPTQLSPNNGTISLPIDVSTTEQSKGGDINRFGANKPMLDIVGTSGGVGLESDTLTVFLTSNFSGRVDVGTSGVQSNLIVNGNTNVVSNFTTNDLTVTTGVANDQLCLGIQDQFVPCGSAI